MSRWTEARTPSHKDKLLLEDVRREAARQRTEALGFLAEARKVGQALRDSRQRNHYGMLLEDIFQGGNNT